VQYHLLPANFENDPEIAFGKAQCYSELGNYNEAFRLYGSILKKQPANTLVYLERADLYMQQKKYYEAEKDYKTALKLDPANVEVFYLHCQAAYYAGFLNDACESCKQAVFYGVHNVDKKFMKSCGK
jgi:tetratricopeptide (TPR) repeat protein